MTASDAPAVNSITWLHPRRGRIVEWLCHEHKIEVIGALAALGIGWIEQRNEFRTLCDRCAYSAMGGDASGRYVAWLVTLPDRNPSGP